MTTVHSTQPDRSTLPATPVVMRGPRNVDIESSLVDIGAGKPVVFLHGLVGLNEHWDRVAIGVKHRARCLMLEVPLLRLRRDDCSIQAVTDMTLQFLERDIGEPVVLVGNSFGGHVALRIALKKPGIVRGLVLAGSSGLMEKTMVRIMRHGPPKREWLVEKIAELFHDRRNMKPADVERAYAELSQRDGARAMVRLSRTARKNHLGEFIPRVKAPTLLIWGKQDVVTPPQAAEEFLELLPDARLVWLDECGHAPMIEKPAEFASSLEGFLDELDAKDRDQA